MATGRAGVSTSPLETRAVRAVRSAAPTTVIALGVFAAVRGAECWCSASGPGGPGGIR